MRYLRTRTSQHVDMILPGADDGIVRNGLAERDELTVMPDGKGEKVDIGDLARPVDAR